MRGILKSAAALTAGAFAPFALSAQDAPSLPSDETLMKNVADRFFEVLRGEGNATLDEIMHPDGVIMVANRMDPANPRLGTLTNTAYMASFKERNAPFTELMNYEALWVRDGVAQLWGPYRLIRDGKTVHCGINSMSFVEVEEGNWQLGNTSFTMVAPDQCDNVGAPPEPVE